MFKLKSNERHHRECFVYPGSDSGFFKCVNGGHSLTRLFFALIGNLVKLGGGGNAGGGWLLFLV